MLLLKAGVPCFTVRLLSPLPWLVCSDSGISLTPTIDGVVAAAANWPILSHFQGGDAVVKPSLTAARSLVTALGGQIVTNREGGKQCVDRKYVLSIIFWIDESQRPFNFSFN